MSAAFSDESLRQVLQDLNFSIAMADRAALERLWCLDATMHFPGPAASLAVGRAAVVARFERLFAELAARIPQAPYMRFRIEEFAWQPLETRHAAVYATLLVDGRLGRRTLIVRAEPDGLRILHLHSSNIGAARSAEAG